MHTQYIPPLFGYLAVLHDLQSSLPTLSCLHYSPLSKDSIPSIECIIQIMYQAILLMYLFSNVDIGTFVDKINSDSRAFLIERDCQR